MKKTLLISRKAEKRFQLEAKPKLQITHRSQLHKIVDKINRLQEPNAQQYYKASELNSIMLLNQVFARIIDNYKQDSSFAKLIQQAENQLPQAELAHFWHNFKELFGLKKAKPEQILPEIIITWLHNINPAAAKYRDLFSDEPLRYSLYENFISLLQDYFDSNPQATKKDKSLIQMLQEPLQKHPHSLEKQLNFVRDNWGKFLQDDLVELLSALDFIKEENKSGFMGPGPAEVYNFTGEDDYERFSEDSSWMPKLVMLAKSTYVWLDQLSKKYKTNINRLDEIPEAELQQLAQQGFTGLWLIGIWQRSAASQKIKHLTGNKDAIASAYSLYDYEIASDLGGQEALDVLLHKAWKYSIRLGCDMVPNHVGIDSKWIYQHPDWFIQTDRSPFPNYTFSNLNLSTHPDFEIYLEEHYFDRTDAAVVFQMRDHVNQKTRYIYHGNDGTSFPWNDTAQLNYLLPQVRQAVIDEIKSIAHRFPIIRFDAAMTLAKKHFQRLWYPQPGTGGDIPSRSQFSMTKAEFTQHMPIEFWRQVVDEINNELPDTLLLAEAFWMMEGYFVRTLGMHRVYNSAFMNMLKDEENEKYQQSIKNILKFNPQILKRFVNFMSNPDEETAITQFGADDKYFGACVMMSTLPGLPMFAHGQIEGYQERYGMEYARAKWQEQANAGLVNRHQQEIFPILKKRYLFANVKNFKLLDFVSEHGEINKDVFAFTNTTQEETTLVLYHNRYAETSGRVHSGYDYNNNRTVKLAEILRLPNQQDSFVILYDLSHDLEYIFNCGQLHQTGLPIKLQAYKYRVFLKKRLLSDNGLYRQAWQQLQGAGTKNIDHYVAKMKLQPLLDSFANLLKEADIKHLIDSKNYETSSRYLKENFNARLKIFLQEYKSLIDKQISFSETISKINKQLLFAIRTSNYVKCKDIISLQIPPKILTVLKSIQNPQGLLYIRFYWIILHNLRSQKVDSLNLLEEKYLQDVVWEKLQKLNLDAELFVTILKLALLTEDITQQLEKKSSYEMVQELLKNSIVRDFLQVNKYDEILWFNKERFHYFLLAIISTNWFNLSYSGKPKNYKILEIFIWQLWKALQISQFKVKELLNYFKKEE